MNFFRFLTFLRGTGSNARNRRDSFATSRRRASLGIELLENRTLPSANPLVISGFAYNDANHNGLLDPGETVLANSPITLLDQNGQLVATTITDANGFYRFATDPRIPTAPAIITHNVSLPDTPTDWNQTASVPQFDPSLGTLTSVEIINQDPITSDIKVENLSPTGNTITATIAGSLTLNGPGLDANGLVTQIAANESWDASPFDGHIDFSGTDFHDFGAQTAHGSNTTTVTNTGANPNALAQFIGTGSLTYHESAHATSNAQGSGNVVVSIQTSAAAQLTVIYHYIPDNGLKPGNYTIIQTSDPPGMFPGMTTSGNIVPIPNSTGTDTIHWTNGVSSPNNNNFAELQPSSLSGHVYVDANNNGVRDPNEAPIAGSTLTLTGTDDLGPVTRTLISGSDGSFSFANLRPGTYTITQDDPAGFLDGKDSLGSLGGTVTQDKIANITVGTGASGINYDFGEVQPANLAGFVYVDANNNGVKDGGEAGIGNVTLTLTGTDDLGHTVSKTTQTGGDGSYNFQNLRPGTYIISETQPANYLEGKNSVGSQGGTNAGNDQLTNLALNSGQSGANNNFGELQAASLAGFVYVDANDNGTRDTGEAGIPNVTVTLSGHDDQGNNVNVSVLTGNDGSYAFQNLRPGSYTITETQPANYLEGQNAVGSQGGTNAGNDQLTNITLNEGVNGVNNNFGEVQPANLSGFVYVDINNDGIKDPNEAGIGNVTLNLSGHDDQGNSVTATVQTAADGSYAFANLRPGSYTISEVQPTNYFEGKNSVGSQGGTNAATGQQTNGSGNVGGLAIPLGGTNAGNDLLTNLNVGPGVSGINNNFGELPPASVSGFVYVDQNRNGVKDGGDSGLGGITLTLTGTDYLGRAVRMQQVTAGDGSYHFTNLAPGTYAVMEGPVSGYDQGSNTMGSLGGQLGTTNEFTAIVADPGANGVNYDFGWLQQQCPSKLWWVGLWGMTC